LYSIVLVFTIVHISESALAAKADGSRLPKEEVTEDDIAEIISKWTGAAGVDGVCRPGDPRLNVPL
jgi:hypothetical protein